MGQTFSVVCATGSNQESTPSGPPLDPLRTPSEPPMGSRGAAGRTARLARQPSRCAARRSAAHAPPMGDDSKWRTDSSDAVGNKECESPAV
eukprot:15396-Prorocentrum_minimum.AAC.1